MAGNAMRENIFVLDCIGVEKLRGAYIFSIREVLPAALGLPPRRFRRSGVGLDFHSDAPLLPSLEPLLRLQMRRW